MTLTYVMTPRKSSKTESKTSALSGASAPAVSGGGMRFTIASRTSAHPRPVFAETRSGESISIASMSSISRETSFTSALGRSTLLRTGTISRFASCAK